MVTMQAMAWRAGAAIASLTPIIEQLDCPRRGFVTPDIARAFRQLCCADGNVYDHPMIEAAANGRILIPDHQGEAFRSTRYSAPTDFRRYILTRTTGMII